MGGRRQVRHQLRHQGVGTSSSIRNLQLYSGLALRDQGVVPPCLYAFRCFVTLNDKRIKTKIFYHLVSSAPQVLSKLLSVVIFQKPTWKVKRNKIIISDTSSTRISWVRGTHFPRLVSLSNSALLLSRASL